MAVVCLVLGLWGVYDYIEVIPSRMLAHERGDTARAVRDAIVPGGPQEARQTARELLEEEQQRFADQFPEASQQQVALPDDVNEAKALAGSAAENIDSLNEANQLAWATGLALFEAALRQEPTPDGEVLSGVQLHAYEVADLVTQRVAPIKRPSAYDRPTQWAFMLCLPFVPWCLWVYFATKQRVYRLDDDGTLHLPKADVSANAGQVWTIDQIEDIDMSLWMKKSIAWVQHHDGTRVKLDDFKHKNLHLIVGAIASRLYPDEWDAEAKPIKARAAASPDGQVAAAEQSQQVGPEEESAEKS